MKRTVVVVALLALAACGRSGAGGQSASGDACALIADASPLFGANADRVAFDPLLEITSSCHWQAADGRRGGDLLIFSTQNQNGAAARVLQNLSQAWDGWTETPLEHLSGVGDEAVLATDLPGYQTQIVVRKGDKLIALMAWSGDPAMDGATLARRMADTAAAAL